LLPEVDALLICVPTHLHADIATEAMNAGKHIFCEKPIARTLEQDDAIIEAAQRNNVALQGGFVRRFDDE
jgi:predicted dehydrogenase